MAVRTFIVDLQGGDLVTPDTDLIFKIYGSADSYTAAIVTTGSHTTDVDVTVSGGSVTIVKECGSETLFKVSALDEAGNESTLSTATGITDTTIPATPIITAVVDLSSLKPKLLNFSVEDATPTQVNFESTQSIAGMTITGFTISGKTISSVTINGTSTTGHYFTVSSAFTFWDNNTIRLESGDGTVYDFTMEYIVNNISEPTTLGSVYYVDVTTGNNADNGTTEALAFQTLTYALTQVSAGDEIKIKAGDYSAEGSILPLVSGTSSNPIKITGYKTNPDDISTMYYTEGDGALTSAEMPYFAITATDTYYYGLKFDTGVDYYIIKNLQFEGYYSAIRSDSAIGIIADNCISYRAFGTGTNGRGFYYTTGYYNDGTNDHHNDVKGRLTNCISIQSANSTFGVWASGVLLDNCISYYNVPSGDATSSDYSYDIYGSNNIVRNSFAYRIDATSNDKGHGFIVKTNPFYGTVPTIVGHYNLFEQNYAYGLRESYQVRNYGADYNVFKDNEGSGFGIYNDPIGITIWGAASNNIFERNIFNNYNACIEFYSNSENPVGQMTQTNNIIRNNSFYNAQHLFRFRNYQTTNLTVSNTNIYNNTFHTIWEWSYTYENYWTFSNNSMKNNIFYYTGWARVDNTSSVWLFETVAPFTIDNNNFSGGVSPLSIATNNNLLDPTFDTTTNLLPSNTGINVGLSGLVDEDYNRNDRRLDNTVTLGFKEI